MLLIALITAGARQHGAHRVRAGRKRGRPERALDCLRPARTRAGQVGTNQGGPAAAAPGRTQSQARSRGAAGTWGSARRGAVCVLRIYRESGARSEGPGDCEPCNAATGVYQDIAGCAHPAVARGSQPPLRLASITPRRIAVGRATQCYSSPWSQVPQSAPRPDYAAAAQQLPHAPKSAADGTSHP